MDADTGQTLAFSPVRLDKADPGFIGFIRRIGSRSLVVEWYYDAHDTLRSWLLSGYTLCRAVRFLDGKDELYWVLFTNCKFQSKFEASGPSCPRITFHLKFQPSGMLIPRWQPGYEIFGRTLVAFLGRNFSFVRQSDHCGRMAEGCH